MRRDVKRDNPRTKIISLRINYEEWEELTQSCTEAGRTVSDYMREALGLRPTEVACAATLVSFADEIQLLNKGTITRH